MIKDPARNYVWIDIAGLNDAGGKFICLVNGFMVKRLFHLIKCVKFLMPITQDQVTEVRGHMLREHLETI